MQDTPISLLRKPHFIALIFLLMLIFCLNYIDRSAIAYAIEPIKEEFHLNNTEFGFLGSCFSIGYILFSVIGGLIADHCGARKTLFAACFLWSLIGIMTGLANIFFILLILRFSLGVAESPSFPSLIRFMSDHVSKDYRARALAISLAVVPFSAALGAPLVSKLILYFDWHMAYIFLGSLGLILAVLWWYSYRMPQALAKAYKETKMHGRMCWQDLCYLLKQKPILANNVANFTYGYLLFFAMNWLPGFLLQSYGLNLKAVGWLLSLPWLCATIGLVSGGFASDYLFKKTRNLRIARSHLIWIAQLISLSSLLPIIHYHNLNITIFCLCIALGFGFFPNAISYSLNIDLAKKRAATSLGLMNSFFASAGILAPLLTGRLVDLSGNFNSAVYLVMAITLAGIFLILLWQQPKYLNRILNTSLTNPRKS